MFDEERTVYSVMLATKTVVRSSTPFFVVSLTCFYHHRREKTGRMLYGAVSYKINLVLKTQPPLLITTLR